MGGCSLLPLTWTAQAAEPNGHPALFLTTHWGRVGPLRALAHLTVLPFSWPFPGSMSWLSLSPGLMVDPS